MSRRPIIAGNWKMHNNREEILNLVSGIKDAIQTAFPKTIQQRCIVHMIRNSVRFISYKDLKEFCRDLKRIYTAANEKQGYEELQKIKKKWESKYSSALKTWEDNWDTICPIFQ